MSEIAHRRPVPPATSPRSWSLVALLPATLAMGLTAGVFGDWAVTVMPGLATTDDRTFVAAFQALDRAILSPPFMLAFLGALVFTGAATLLCRRPEGRPALLSIVVALGFYLAALVITVAVHEPLNVIIRTAGDADRLADPTAVRDAFDASHWVVWHVVRTLTTGAAFGCLCWALARHGRPAPGPTAPR